LHQFVGYVIIDTMRRYVVDSAALAIAITACLVWAFVSARCVEPVFRVILAASLAASLSRIYFGSIGLIERA
jgi:hypothetical protein